MERLHDRFNVLLVALAVKDTVSFSS